MTSEVVCVDGKCAFTFTVRDIKSNSSAYFIKANIQWIMKLQPTNKLLKNRNKNIDSTTHNQQQNTSDDPQLKPTVARRPNEWPHVTAFLPKSSPGWLIRHRLCFTQQDLLQNKRILKTISKGNLLVLYTNQILLSIITLLLLINYKIKHSRLGIGTASTFYERYLPWKAVVKLFMGGGHGGLAFRFLPFNQRVVDSNLILATA